MTRRITQIFLGLMGLAFCKVGIETLVSPHAVLGQVQIILDNNGALSSMRAIYGGMHLIFGLYCLRGIQKQSDAALTLVILYTSGFVLGRLSGIVMDGVPNEFVLVWLITETISLALAIVLLRLRHKASRPLVESSR